MVKLHFIAYMKVVPWGFTPCRCVWAAGMDCMVVNPADIPGIDKDTRSKTDRIDAGKLSIHLAAENIF
jgi:transposase